MEDEQELEKQKATWGGKRKNSGRRSGLTNKKLIMARNKEIITEPEVRERFRILNDRYKWYDVEYSQEAFPDFILLRNGKRLYCEVEKNSMDFKYHKHNPSGCDIIICWRHDDVSCFLPVIELCGLWEKFYKNN